MDSSIEQLAQSLKAVIMYGDLDAPGHVAFPTCTDVAFVFVNCKLSANKQRTVILHELGHVAKQRDEIDLYNVAMSMKKNGVWCQSFYDQIFV